MTDSEASKNETIDEVTLERNMRSRPRSPTLLKLKWLAERFRKKQVIQDEVRSGSYSTNSEKLAKALLNKDE